MTVYNINSKENQKRMNSRKSKDRAKLYDDNKNSSSSSKPYSYEIIQNSYKMQKDKKSLKIHNQNSESQQKQNQAIFKNMQKCNQKMEYYKLMGSLEEQKRTMLQQEINLLKQQNEQLKGQLRQSQKQIRRLSRKLQKYGNQVAKYQDINISKEKNFIIELPNKHSQQKSKLRVNKSSPKDYQNDHDVNCQKCAYVQQQLNEERELYQKDRTYLKEQIQNLSENLSDTQKQFKIVNKQLSGITAFYNKKLADLSDKFQNSQNELKKQLTLSYRALEEKYDLIRQLELKIDFFQQENHRIIKLLNIFDGTSSEPYYALKKPLPNHLQKQDRSKSAFNVKEKHPKYPNFFNPHQDSLPQENSNIIDNRKKARKCGSIKKIQVD